MPGAPEKGPKCPDQSVLALVKYIFEFSFRFLSFEVFICVILMVKYV